MRNHSGNAGWAEMSHNVGGVTAVTITTGDDTRINTGRVGYGIR